MLAVRAVAPFLKKNIAGNVLRLVSSADKNPQQLKGLNALNTSRLLLAVKNGRL